MNMNLQCPTCGHTVTLEAMPEDGKWTCPCGAAFELEVEMPAAPADSAVTPPPAMAVPPPVQDGVKSCPECGAVLPEDCVQCDACSYNFFEGRKIPPADHVEPDSAAADLDAAERRYQMTRLIVRGTLLLLAVGAGVWLYFAFTAKHYGISASRPMGKTATLDAHIKEFMRMAQRGQPRPAPAALGLAGGTVVTFDDALLAKETNKQFEESMIVVYDAQHNICALSGSFHVLSSAIPGGGNSRVSGFLKDFWEQIGGARPPTFAAVAKKSTSLFDSTPGEQAVFSTKGVQARWDRVSYGSMGLITSLDTITIAREGLDLSAVLTAAGGNEP